jgi:hypothetical protein
MSVIINGSAGVTTNSGAVYDGLQRGTAVASTSGTSVDFTSIPSWVKRITVMFNGVSTNGTSLVVVQAGTTSGFVSSGYGGTASQTTASGAASASSTAGFPTGNSLSGAAVRSGTVTLFNVTGNTWVSSSMLARSDSTITDYGAGVISLGGTLDRVRITAANGTDTFDAGTINIIYE